MANDDEAARKRRADELRQEVARMKARPKEAREAEQPAPESPRELADRAAQEARKDEQGR